jgi:uncharacterized membrane protein YkvA (DUF1232 family)
VRDLRRELHALYLASKDRRTPWRAKALIALVIGYALSPVDLIPDWIPLLGFLDDLVVVPLGILLARRMIPAEVLADCRARADARLLARPERKITLVVVLVTLLWVAGAIAFVWLVATLLNGLLRP